MPEGRSLRGEISLNDKNLKNEIETSIAEKVNPYEPRSLNDKNLKNEIETQR